MGQNSFQENEMRIQETAHVDAFNSGLGSTLFETAASHIHQASRTDQDTPMPPAIEQIGQTTNTIMQASETPSHPVLCVSAEERSIPAAEPKSTESVNEVTKESLRQENNVDQITPVQVETIANEQDNHHAGGCCGHGH